MSFKMSVLFCVLYLFTVAWSIGLDIYQIRKLVELSLKHHMGTIPSDDITTYLLDYPVNYKGDIERFKKNSLHTIILGAKKFKIQKLITPECHNCLSFPIKPSKFVVDNKTMPEFLIMLADEEKGGDNWSDGLTTYEVKLFVGMFNAQDKRGERDGLLTVAEVNKLVDDHLNLKEKCKKEIKRQLECHELINVILFLFAISQSKIKSYDYSPTDFQHLNKAQIDNCLALYNSSESHLDSIKQLTLFKSLNIVSKEYEYLLDFPHVRPAALELQEVLVFCSEYDKDFDKEAPFITSTSHKMWKFKTFHDKNRDGLLDIQEIKESVSDVFAPNVMEAFMKEFDPGDSRPMCAAMFLKMFLYLYPEEKP